MSPISGQVQLEPPPDPGPPFITVVTDAVGVARDVEQVVLPVAANVGKEDLGEEVGVVGNVDDAPRLPLYVVAHVRHGTRSTPPSGRLPS